MMEKGKSGLSLSFLLLDCAVEICLVPLPIGLLPGQRFGSAALRAAAMSMDEDKLKRIHQSQGEHRGQRKRPHGLVKVELDGFAL